MNPALIVPLAKEIIDLFRKVDKNEIPLKEAEAKMEQVINERMGILSELLKGQIDINKIEAEAGRLGWRNWLGKGLTIALLYGLLGVPVVKSLLALSTLFGVDVNTVTSITTLMPEFRFDVIYPIIMGLLGLYGMRGYEKKEYAKIGSMGGFSKEVFYDTIRKESGGKITQPQVDMIEEALKKAGLK